MRNIEMLALMYSKVLSQLGEPELNIEVEKVLLVQLKELFDILKEPLDER